VVIVPFRCLYQSIISILVPVPQSVLTTGAVILNTGIVFFVLILAPYFFVLIPVPYFLF
jgi:hypothetical protein